MKQVIIILALCCSSGNLLAQGVAQKVLAAVEQLRLAMIGGDSLALDRLTARQLSYGHSGGGVDDKAGFVHKLVSGQSDFVDIALTEQSVAISGKTAIVRHLLRATTNDGGKPGEVLLKVLLVWQKQKGSWKLLARQAVKALS
jgi:hypothetical protein